MDDYLMFNDIVVTNTSVVMWNETRGWWDIFYVSGTTSNISHESLQKWWWATKDNPLCAVL